MTDIARIPYTAAHGFVSNNERTVTIRTASKQAELLDLELKPRKRRGESKA